MTLLPGVYYLKGGGLSVSGNATVTGTGGVIIVNAPQGSGGAISFSGNATVTLVAPASLPGAYAPYAGIAIFQDPASATAISIAGNAALKTTGIVLAAGAGLNLSGNAAASDGGSAAGAISAAIICRDVSVGGNSVVTVNATANTPLLTPFAVAWAAEIQSVQYRAAEIARQNVLDAALESLLEEWESFLS